jgi:FtsZ-binding cell division protein ZapB
MLNKLIMSLLVGVFFLGSGFLSKTTFAAEVSNQQQITPVNDLGIYYGYPSYVNGSNGDVTKAIEAFKPFETIVLGDGIEHLSHGDHKKTQQIIDGLKPTRNKIFGYVPIGALNGATNSNLSNSTIEAYIDEWKNMGVYGVFLDEYGFDYNVTRARQNEIVSYAHNKGLSVFANAWVPKDAMGDLNEKGNVEKAKLDSRDYFLMEDWISENGSLQSSKDWVKKADDALSFSKTTGVKISMIATVPDPKTANVNDIKFKLVAYATAMYGFDSFQWTDNNYSASNNYLNTYSLPNYGTYFTDNAVTHNSDYTVMTRKTDKGTFKITQNSTTKNGEFISDSSSTDPTTIPITTPTQPATTPTNDLQKQIDELKAQVSTLQTDNSRLQQNVTDLTKENKSLKDDNSGLTSKLGLIKTAINEFVAKINSILN